MGSEDFETLREEVRARNDIVDVIGSYLNLHKAGGTWKALCPFHKEKTPSFNVDSRRQVFHCFGCKKNGDVFSFIMEQEGVDFMTSMQLLGRRVGIEVEDRLAPAGSGRKSGVGKPLLFEILDKLAKDYHRQLMQAPEAAGARDYLDKRKLLSSAADWTIGYAPDRWDGVVQWGKKNDYSIKALTEAGLLTHKEGRPDDPYDRFRDRIMFPLRDETGRIIGFSGRVVNKESSPAKYVNSPETPVFKKSKVLYGIEKGRRSIVDERQVILCEGQTDVIRCHLAGITQAVAALGTAITTDHARVLKRYADEVILVLDADQAGETAAIKAARVFMPFELNVKVAQLAEDEDPDSLILKQGPEAFRERIANAEAILEFQYRAMSRQNTLLEGAELKNATTELLETIGKSNSPIQQDRLIADAARLLKVRTDDVKNAFVEQSARKRKPRNESPDEPAPAEAVSTTPGPPEERALMEILLSHPDESWLVERYLPLDCITHDACRTVIHAVLNERGDEVIHSLSEDDGCKNLAIEASTLR